MTSVSLRSFRSSFHLRFLIIAGFISGCFLFLQLYTLHTVVTAPPPSSFTRPGSSLAPPRPPSAPPATQKYAILGVVKRFVDLMVFLEIPVFIVDPAILKHLLVLSLDGNNRCKYFCQVPDSVVTFGVASNFWPYKDSIVKTITSGGFRLAASHAMIDPRPAAIAASHGPAQTSVAPTIRTHFLFESNGFFIHLLIFYERSSDSFWFAKFDLPSVSNATALVFKLRLGSRCAGSISRIETTRVNLDGIKVFVPKDPIRVMDDLPNADFIECNHSRATAFFKRQPRDSSQAGETFRSLARKTILTAGRVLDALGIKFWISSGTCLGWYRQCDVITYSGDVDFGIFIHDYDARLIAEFQRAGLELTHLFGKTTDSFDLSFRLGDMKLDLFFFYKEGDDWVWNGGTQARTGKKFKYLFPRFRLCWAELMQVRVRVPCPTLPYIEANYGTQWIEPQKHWDWKKSPPNVRENGQWPKEDWDQVIQIFEN